MRVRVFAIFAIVWALVQVALIFYGIGYRNGHGAATNDAIRVADVWCRDPLTPEALRR